MPAPPNNGVSPYQPILCFSMSYPSRSTFCASRSAQHPFRLLLFVPYFSMSNQCHPHSARTARHPFRLVLSVSCHSIPHCVLCVPTARHPFRLVLSVPCHSIPFYGLPACIPRATCPATPNGKKKHTPIYNVPARSQSEPIRQKNPPKPSLEG